MTFSMSAVDSATDSSCLQRRVTERVAAFPIQLKNKVAKPVPGHRVIGSWLLFCDVAAAIW